MPKANCLACGHAAEIDGSLEDAVFRCDECKALMHYGQRVIVQPDNYDLARPKVVIRLQTPEGETELRIDARDPSFIVSLAKNILSLVA